MKITVEQSRIMNNCHHQPKGKLKSQSSPANVESPTNLQSPTNVEMLEDSDKEMEGIEIKCPPNGSKKSDASSYRVRRVCKV